MTLELGGKSPTIVHEDADIVSTARRIAYGKTINAGQTCVAPDYLIVHASIYQEFLTELRRQIDGFYHGDALASPDYGAIVNERRFDTLVEYLDQGDVSYGGRAARESLKIEPTILENVDLNDPVMLDEIFGPILPVLSYSTEDELFDIVTRHESPLALYVFTMDGAFEERIIRRIPFGGGIGSSGTGAYHGKHGFDTMTHSKSIIKTPHWMDIALKYPPYGKNALKMLRSIFK